jgi:TolA-binding protein
MRRQGGRTFRFSVLIGLTALPGCATKGQVQLLEGELRSLRVETARRDSARAAALAAVIVLQQRILDSVAAGREALRTLDVRVQNDLVELQRQMLQVQELTGQSQQRLTQLKAQIDANAERAEAATVVRSPADSGAPAGMAGVPSADQMFEGARRQQLSGAQGTARMAYQELIRNYPGNPRVPDALFYIGESYGSELPDSALAYYGQVLTRFKDSGRAPVALYRMGRLEEARRNPAAARTYYERLVKDYPTSDEADPARERLKTLRP